jgi:hypothetical protein
MFGPSERPSSDVASGLSRALDGLLEVDPASLSDDELGDAVVDVRRLEARLAAATARLTAEFDGRRTWAVDGSRACAPWLAHRLQLPVGHMRDEVRLARRLRSMPETSDGLASGDIGVAHAHRLASLNAGRTAHAFPEAEGWLVGKARAERWVDFCRITDYWRQVVDPNGVEQDAATDEELRRVHLSEGWRGTGILDGLLTPLGRATMASALDQIEQELFDADWSEVRAEHGDAACLGNIRRTPAQRRHDALVELATRAMTAPADGRRPRPLVSVLVGYETFAGRVCELADGTVITPGTVASMLDQVDIERAVFDGPSRVLDLGRARSFVGAARRALELRDRQCTHITCDVPARRCQGDHIVAWSEGGITTPDNGQLRCGYHNRWRCQVQKE